MELVCVEIGVFSVEIENFKVEPAALLPVVNAFVINILDEVG